MDQATKAALAMGMFTGEAHYQQAENICVGCGIQKFSAWAGRAQDPAGRMRGVCTPCLRRVKAERGFVFDDQVLDWFLTRISDGRL